MKTLRVIALFVVIAIGQITFVAASGEMNEFAARISNLEETVKQFEAKSSRQLNELEWFQRLSDLAVVDKVYFTGPAPEKPGVAEAMGSRDVLVPALTFLPRNVSARKKLPLLVIAHGGIHGNAASEELHIVRELIVQGYAVIAPDYRGSSGYGSAFWRMIDYGGLEIEDVHAARNYMLDRHPRLDRKRVGIIGWSHGGAIALMTACAHPTDYQAVYAGVPVSDLAERIRILGAGYEQNFAAPYHIGKTVAEAPEEYRRRSAINHVGKLTAPLLLHANTNDPDVQFPEIQRLISALNDAGKKFERHIYTNAPGGHYFNRLDTALALESRREIWRFLGKHLRPPNPIR